MMFTRMIRQIKSALTGKSFSGRDNEMSKVAPLKSSSNSTTHFSQNSQSSYSKQPKVANSVSTDSYSLNNSMHPLESVKDEESQIVPAEEEVGVGHANGGGADMSSKSHKLQHSQSQVSTTSSSKALVWSGNVMEESDSRKVFQALVVHGEELEESSPQMVSDLFPNYLQVGDEGEVFAQSPSVKVFGGEEVTISTDVSHLKESQIQQATNVIDAY